MMTIFQAVKTWIHSHGCLCAICDELRGNGAAFSISIPVHTLAVQHHTLKKWSCMIMT